MTKQVYGASQTKLGTGGKEMESNTTTAITAIKQEVKLREWLAQVEEQKASGMTVKHWCAANGINPKTYYYHLRKVRERSATKAPVIVPLNAPRQSSDIHIEKDGLCISLPSDIGADTLIALVHELC